MVGGAIMEKLSHKALLSEGRRLNGLYFSGNVYEYENCIAMIQNLREDKKRLALVKLTTIH